MTYKQLPRSFISAIVIVCLWFTTSAFASSELAYSELAYSELANSELANETAKTEISWPDWQRFKQHMVSSDGRVIDYSPDNAITTSEGQSYGMFFALVNNEPETFDNLFRWTQNNLADGNLKTNLPAWQWGEKSEQEEKSWGIIDSNSASDSDLWIAYNLLEAAKLWNNQHYKEVGLALSELILEQETADIPGLGLTLLPGKIGFVKSGSVENSFFKTEPSWKLNPSYVPIQLLRALHKHTKDNRWQEIIDSSDKLITQTAPQGFSPDWVVYQRSNGFSQEPQIGSYNAIRVYLWAGMLDDQEPLKRVHLKTFKPMADYLQNNLLPPEKINHITTKVTGNGPIGFTAALLPFLTASNAKTAQINQLTRLITQPLSEKPKRYYDQVLGLFGVGWIQKRYTFDKNGHLVPRWR